MWIADDAKRENKQSKPLKEHGQRNQMGKKIVSASSQDTDTDLLPRGDGVRRTPTRKTNNKPIQRERDRENTRTTTNLSTDEFVDTLTTGERQMMITQDVDVCWTVYRHMSIQVNDTGNASKYTRNAHDLCEEKWRE